MPFDPTSGFAQVVPFGLEEYLGLVDTMGRAVHPSKRVAILASTPPLLGAAPIVSSAACVVWRQPRGCSKPKLREDARNFEPNRPLALTQQAQAAMVFVLASHLDSDFTKRFFGAVFHAIWACRYRYVAHSTDGRRLSESSSFC